MSSEPIPRNMSINSMGDMTSCPTTPESHLLSSPDTPERHVQYDVLPTEVEVQITIPQPAEYATAEHQESTIAEAIQLHSEDEHDSAAEHAFLVNVVTTPSGTIVALEAVHDEDEDANEGILWVNVNRRRAHRDRRRAAARPGRRVFDEEDSADDAEEGDDEASSASSEVDDDAASPGRGAGEGTIAPVPTPIQIDDDIEMDADFITPSPTPFDESGHLRPSSAATFRTYSPNSSTTDLAAAEGSPLHAQSGSFSVDDESHRSPSRPFTAASRNRNYINLRQWFEIHRDTEIDASALLAFEREAQNDLTSETRLFGSTTVDAVSSDTNA